jgi:hypothetical protein
VIAQIFLSLLLCAVFLYAWIEYRRSPVVAVLSAVVALAGLYFVWMPSQSTWLAEFVGIGRGVDLILYTWVGISLIVALNLHLKLRTQLELITILARTIALANPIPAPAEGQQHSPEHALVPPAAVPRDVRAERRTVARTGRRSSPRGDQTA